jgi:hypothetical protein
MNSLISDAFNSAKVNGPITIIIRSDALPIIYIYMYVHTNLTRCGVHEISVNETPFWKKPIRSMFDARHVQRKTYVIRTVIISELKRFSNKYVYKHAVKMFAPHKSPVTVHCLYICVYVRTEVVAMLEGNSKFYESSSIKYGSGVC